MLKGAINRIDVLQVFNWFGIAMGSIIALAVAASVALMIEPRDLIGNRKLDVRMSDSDLIQMRAGSRFIQSNVSVVLPNGNEHSFMAYSKQISAERTVCATLKLGRWTDAYHIKIVALDACW